MKTVQVTLKGKIEIGKVKQENHKTVYVYFKHMPKQPTLKLKKNKCKLMYGDQWGK